MRVSQRRPPQRSDPSSTPSVVTGKREREHGATFGHGLRPDPPSMRFNDLPADCEAYAGARIFGLAVEPFKWRKDTFRVLWVEADAVVADTEDPLVLLSGNRNVNLWSLRPAIFNSVCKQILKDS